MAVTLPLSPSFTMTLKSGRDCTPEVRRACNGSSAQWLRPELRVRVKHLKAKGTVKQLTCCGSKHAKDPKTKCSKTGVNSALPALSKSLRAKPLTATLTPIADPREQHKNEPHEGRTHN
jgi:hypothetical protein